MPGTYTITTRAPGTIITALIYNHDHQVHVDGRSANAGMASHAANVAQMQRQVNPYPGAVVSLPGDFGSEIERLRYVLSDIAGVVGEGTPTPNWYTPIYPAFPTIGARMLQSAGQTVTSGVQAKITFNGAATDFNTNTTFDPLFPTRFTAPFTGKYYAGATILWSAPISGVGNRQLRLGVNNTFVGFPWDVTTSANSAQPQYNSVHTILDLTAGDYVEFAAFQTSAGNVDIIGDADGLGLPSYAGQLTAGYLVFIGS